MSKKILLNLALLAILSGNNILSTNQFLNSSNNKSNNNELKQLFKDAIIISDIDGSSLQGDNLTYLDGIAIIEQHIQKIDNNAIVELFNKADYSKKLTKDSNLFVIKIIVGKEERKAVTNLTNVNLSSVEQATKIVNKLEKTIDGSKLDVTIKYKNIINFLNILVKKTNQVKIALANNNEEDQFLVAANNELNINIIFDSNNIIKKTLIIKNVKLNNTKVFKSILNDFKLKTINTIDAKKLGKLNLIDTIEQYMLNHIPIANLEVIDFKENNETYNVNAKISIGENSIVKSFKIKNLVLQSQMATLSDDEKKLQDIHKKINELIVDNYPSDDPKHLTINSTFSEAMDVIRQHLIKTYKNITFDLKDNNIANDYLKEGNNAIQVLMTLNNAKMEVTIYISDVTMTDEERLNMVQAELNKIQIDGSKLTTSNVEKDTLNLIVKTVRKIHKRVAVELADIKGTKKLVENKNMVEIIVTSNKLRKKMSVTIVNVKKSNADKLEEVAQILQNFIFDGKDYKAGNKVSTMMNLFDSKLKESKFAVKPKLLNPDQELVSGTNKIDIELSIGNNSKTVTLTVNNVAEADKLLKEVLVDDTVIIDGSTLTTDQTINDTLQLVKTKIQEQLKKSGFDDKNSLTLQLVLESDAQRKLVSGGTNIFNLNISANGQTVTKKIEVNNVQLSDSDRIANVVKLIPDQISGETLTTDDLYAKALEIIAKKVSDEIDKNVVIELDNKDEATKKLEVNNQITIKITSGDKSTTKVISFIDVKLSNKDKIDKVGTEIEDMNLKENDWTTDNTNKDVSDWIKDKIKEKFGDDNDIDIKVKNENNKLTPGNQEIELEITVGNETKTIKVKVDEVPLSKGDKFNKINELIEKLNIDGSDLESGQLIKENQIQQFIKDKINDVIKDLIDDNSNVNIRILDEGQLVTGENKIRVLVNIDGQEIEQTIKINNVKLSDSDRVNQFIAKIKDQKVDGSTLTTDNDIGDAYDLILDVIAKIDANVKMDVDDSIHELDDYLEAGDNKITVRIKSGYSIKNAEFIVKNIKVSDKDHLSKLINSLRDYIIDGSVLTTANNYGDVLNQLIKEVKENFREENFKIDLAVNQDWKKTLTKDDNKITFKITIGTESEDIELTVANVKLSDPDKLNKIANDYNNKVIDFSDYTTENTISDFVAKVTEIINKVYSDAKITAVNDSNFKIKAGRNELKIKVEINDISKDIIIIADQVKLSNQDRINDIKNYIENELKSFDGSTLTTDNKIIDALDLIRKEIAKKDPNIIINLKNSKNSVNKLNANNEIEIVIVAIDKSESLTVKVENVKLSDTDIMNNLIAEINKEIDGSKLTTANTYQDAVKLIQDKFKELNEDVIMNLVDQTTLNNKLTENNNTIILELKLNDIKKIVTFKVNKVELSDKDKLEKFGRLLSSQNEIINKDLTTGLTIADLKNKLQKLLNNETIIITFTKDGVKLDENMKLGSIEPKKITINMSLKTETKSIDYSIENVKLSETDFFNKVEEYVAAIDGRNFNNDNTQDDVLTKLKDSLKNITNTTVFTVDLKVVDDKKKTLNNNDYLDFVVTRDGVTRVFRKQLTNLQKTRDLEKLDNIINFFEKTAPMPVPLLSLNDKAKLIARVKKLLKDKGYIVKNNEITIDVLDYPDLVKKVGGLVGTYTMRLKLTVGKISKETLLKFRTTLL